MPFPLAELRHSRFGSPKVLQIDVPCQPDAPCGLIARRLEALNQAC